MPVCVAPHVYFFDLCFFDFFEEYCAFEAPCGFGEFAAAGAFIDADGFACAPEAF
ncbi:MAG: hypothetical protein P4M02_06570 [Clostridia bacterium]|nr:hypothetical protein [Clostridia bacterium]